MSRGRGESLGEESSGEESRTSTFSQESKGGQAMKLEKLVCKLAALPLFALITNTERKHTSRRGMLWVTRVGSGACC